MKSKLKVVAPEAFSAEKLAEGVVLMKSAEEGRRLVNGQLKLAKTAKMHWVELRDSINSSLERRGLKDGTLRTTLSTIKWCFEKGVELETLTLSRMKERAEKGLATDLVTGKPVTVKGPKKDPKKGQKAKTEATVKHCGYGMAEAMEQDGFLAFLNALVYDLYADERDFGALMDDDKLDFVRHALRDCGYMVQDGAEWKVKVIREADNESAE